MLIPEDSQDLAGNFPVKPEPQWEERVEEVEGTEPVLLPTRKPIEHLLQHVHTRQEVNDAVREFFAPFVEEAKRDEQAKRGEQPGLRKYRSGEGEWGDKKEWLEGLEELLTALMDRPA